MPFVTFPYGKRFSDLVFHELDPSVGYARECVNVTPPAGGAAVELGTVAVRALTETDPYAPYTVLAGAADLVDTNEFVVLYGDEYSFNPSFVPFAVDADTFNAVGFKRGPLQLKDYYIKQVSQDADGAALTDAEFETLRELLKRQGVIVEVTV